MDEEECCGTCRFHKPDPEVKDSWVCTNFFSEYDSDWAEYDDYCVDYERKGKWDSFT